jgi:hypothetical protein
MEVMGERKIFALEITESVSFQIFETSSWHHGTAHHVSGIIQRKPQGIKLSQNSLS